MSRGCNADIPPLEVRDGLDFPGKALAHADADAGKTAELADGLDVLALVLHTDRVFVGAGYHIDGTADQGLKGLRPTTEIVDGGLDAFFLEETFAFGNGEGQIIEKRLAADTEHELRLFRCGGRVLRIGGQARGNACKPKGGGAQQYVSTGCPHGLSSLDFYNVMRRFARRLSDAR